MKSKQPIKDYWLNALRNSELGALISPTEQAALPFLKNLESNITVDCIEVILAFDDSEWIKGGKYRRSIKLSAQGTPESLEGEEFSLLKYISDEDKDLGLLNILGTNTNIAERVEAAFDSMTYLTNELIPYSLNFFLGAGEQLDDF